jgi:hypothetical protein
MYRRIWTVMINYMAGFHVAYVYFVLVAVVISTYRAFLQHTVKAKLTAVVTHAFWPPLAWVIVVSSFWIPVSRSDMSAKPLSNSPQFQYAVDPPNMPPRESLLERNPKTGVAHPTAKAKKIGISPQTIFFELEYTFTTAFTTLVFVASFFY